MDLQSIGRQLAWYRRENKKLHEELVDCQIKLDGMKLLLEEVMLSPGSYEYFTDRSNHPMKSDDKTRI